MSPATRTLGEMAREGRTAQAWKQYLAAPRREKDLWKGERVAAASRDWKTYKALTKPKRAWGDEYMLASDSAQPVRDIKDQFETVFHDSGRQDVEGELKRMVAGMCEGKEITPFTPDEVRLAVLQGKRGKAVGPDGVPIELLQKIVRDDASCTALTMYFNQILESGEVPKQWDESIAGMLPKISPPKVPKHLRPIALASHIPKAFSRLLLLRLEPLLRPSGKTQFSGKGPADLMWLTMHVAHLSREWNTCLHSQA